MTGSAPAPSPGAHSTCALKPAYIVLAAVVAAFVALGAYVLALAYERQEQAAFAAAGNLTRVIAERLEATLRRADNDLRAFVQFLPPDAMQEPAATRYREKFEARFMTQLAQFPEIASRNVVDAHGVSLYRLGAMAPRTNFSDREWFRTLRDNPQIDAVISDVVTARASGKPTLVLSRAIRGPGGRFLGTANATLNLDMLQRLLASLDVGPNGRIVVRKTGTENKLVLRHPEHVGALNSTAKTQTQSRILAGETYGRLRTVSPLDNMELATSFRVLDEFPFSISVGIAKQDYLFEWRRTAAITGVAGCALLILLVTFVVQRVRNESRLAELAATLKRNKIALRANEQFLRDVIESTSDGILVEGTDGRVLATNRRFRAMWQVPDAWAAGTDRSLLNSHMAALLESPAELPASVDVSGNRDVVTFRPLELRDGRRIEPDVGTLLRDGELAGRVWSFHDVTERKRTHRMYRSIIDSSADAFVAFDASLRITAVSARAESIFGAAAAELTGRTLAETILPDADAADGTVQKLLAAVRGGDVEASRKVCEVQARRIDTRAFPAEIQISGFAMGEDWQYTSFIRDISSRMLAEEQLAQAQKLEAIGQLTGGLAHDFNNILGIVIGSLDLLEVESDDNRELRAAALAAARRGTEVTKSLLAVARRKKLSPRDVAVDDLINELAPLLRQTAGKRVNVSIDAASGGATAHLDPSGFSSAMLNLVINARDAMPDGGELIIRATAVARCSEGVARSVVSVTVADSGCGMTPEVAARAFDPFFTTKVRGKGTGLGLAMAYSFAQQSGGTATIVSTPGAGTTVELLLPAQHVAAAGAAAQPGELQARGHGETVLVVDDEPDLLRIAQQWLTHLGFRVTAETDAQRALELLATRPFDALVSDVIMPGVLDGATLAERATRCRPGIAILLVSGYADTLLARIEGRFPLLDKPYTQLQLGAALRAVLDQRRPRAPAPVQIFAKNAA